jgi:hypothetical protein
MAAICEHSGPQMPRANHVGPDLKRDWPIGSARARGDPDGVIEQSLRRAHVHQQRRQSGEVRAKRGNERICRISSAVRFEYPLDDARASAWLRAKPKASAMPISLACRSSSSLTARKSGSATRSTTPISVRSRLSSAKTILRAGWPLGKYAAIRWTSQSTAGSPAAVSASTRRNNDSFR